ncbi:MAG: hypothetical protein II207_02985 [Clostridia bacterium]|nr:hypothetical protein [Clostridia bacterium]
MKLSNRAYDVLKAISLTAGYIVTFISGILAVVLPTDTGKFVVAIVTVVIGGAGTLAGQILRISSKRYYDEQAEKGENEDVHE